MKRDGRMKINLVGLLLVLDKEESMDIKKNDKMVLRVLVKKKDHSLIRISFDDKSDIKELLRISIADIIGSKKFHLEQVYTLGDKKYYQDHTIDILYLALTNRENIKKLSLEYELVPFEVKGNVVTLGNQKYPFKTVEKITNNNAEYIHEVKVGNLELEKQLVEMITMYKHLRVRLDQADICFKLLPEAFTLEEVRMVYEMIKEVEVDKSNFRKRVVKFCDKVDEVVHNKGYRPTQMYRFNPKNNEIWL